jgi:hypothetical protein
VGEAELFPHPLPADQLLREFRLASIAPEIADRHVRTVQRIDRTAPFPHRPTNWARSPQHFLKVSEGRVRKVRSALGAINLQLEFRAEVGTARSCPRRPERPECYHNAEERERRKNENKVVQGLCLLWHVVLPRSQGVSSCIVAVSTPATKAAMTRAAASDRSHSSASR